MSEAAVSTAAAPPGYCGTEGSYMSRESQRESCTDAKSLARKQAKRIYCPFGREVNKSNDHVHFQPPFPFLFLKEYFQISSELT